MLLKIWRLLTIMLTGLSMGTALCHLLEMPAKITYDGALWLTLLQTLYPRAFGTIGASFEVGALSRQWCSRFWSAATGQPSFGHFWEHSVWWPLMRLFGYGSLR